MRLADVQRVCDISKTENFDKWRTRVGKERWEHREKAGDHRGVWIWSPGWFSAYGALRASELPGASAAVDQELNAKQRLDAIKLRNAELDLDERELKHAERKQEIIRVDELNEIFVFVFGGIARVADRLPDEQKLLISEEMKEGVEAYTSRFNGHSDPRITDLGRAKGVRTRRADRNSAPAADASRVRAKVRRDASRRSKGGPEVS